MRNIRYLLLFSTLIALGRFFLGIFIAVNDIFWPESIMVLEMDIPTMKVLESLNICISTSYDWHLAIISTVVWFINGIMIGTTLLVIGRLLQSFMDGRGAGSSQRQ